MPIATGNRLAAPLCTARPQGCFYWGAVWTLAAWRDTRLAFRDFRLARNAGPQVNDTGFRDEPGRMLADLLRAQRP